MQHAIKGLLRVSAPTIRPSILLMQFEYFINLLSAFDIFVLSGIQPLNGEWEMMFYIKQ